MRLIARPVLIKINNEELKDIYPELDEESPEDILRILKDVTLMRTSSLPWEVRVVWQNRSAVLPNSVT